jgi:methionyl-tRNA synthetase
VREIMALADRANQYIDEQAPWVVAKQPDGRRPAAGDLHPGPEPVPAADRLARPILPGTAEAAEQFLRMPPLTWDALAEPLLDHEIAKFKPLMTRVDPKQIEAMLEASKEDLRRRGRIWDRIGAASRPRRQVRGKPRPRAT